MKHYLAWGEGWYKVVQGDDEGFLDTAKKNSNIDISKIENHMLFNAVEHYGINCHGVCFIPEKDVKIVTKDAARYNKAEHELTKRLNAEFKKQQK